MANTNVSGISPISSNVVGQTKGTSTRRKPTNMTFDFKSYIDSKNQGSYNDTKSFTETSVASNATAGKTSESIKKVDSKRQLVEKVEGEVERHAKDIIDRVAEDLDVTAEEITNVMEMLGITITELFQPQKLVEIFAQVRGVTDTTSIILDADFTQMLDNVTEYVSEVCEELGLMPVEFENILAELEPISKESLPFDTAIDVDMLQAVDDQISLEESKETSMEIKDDFTTDKDLSESGKEFDVTENIVSSNEFGAESSNQHNFDSETDEPLQNSNESKSIHDNHVTAYVEENFAPVEDESIVLSNNSSKAVSSIDTIDVIKQIVQKLSVSTSMETSTIEMQLNPENLGKMYINVSEKNSEISAHIAVTNEAVKEALETQMVELRENLNQAGIKVDSVEVTVASHEFERNLEQSESGATFSDDGKHQRGTSKNAIEGLVDKVNTGATEEVELAKKIMLDNGNSVDFTA